MFCQEDGKIVFYDQFLKENFLTETQGLVIDCTIRCTLFTVLLHG